MNLYINGEVVKAGQKIKSFRGETWTFHRVSRDAEPGKSGKVLVSRGKWSQEYYPSVFKGEIK